ncbi:MAG: glycosyltransferase [Pseudomonadales bacterium]
MPDSRVRSMHVLHLTADRQIDRRILQSARSLERAGWTASIVAMPRDTPGNDEANVIRIGAAVPARENLVVNVYRAARRHLGVNRGPVRWMKRLAWRHVVDPRSFYERLFWPTVAGMTADVVVANDLPMLPVATRLAESCGARLVYDSHELYCEQEFSRQERERWQAIEARFVPGCDAIITVNDSIARELEERYRLDHVHVILNAAERVPSSAPVTNLHARLGLDAGRRILLCRGGLSTGRNIDVLVRAMALVAGSDISLVLLGDGELAPILDDLIARARLPATAFTGWRFHGMSCLASPGLHPRRGNPVSGRLPQQHLLHAKQTVRIHRSWRPHIDK